VERPALNNPGAAADIRQMTAGYAAGVEAATVPQGSASGKKEPSSPSLPDLPVMAGIRFEKHSKGGFEAWKIDESTRRGKRYLCYIGQKRLAEGPDGIAAFIRDRERDMEKWKIEQGVHGAIKS
jgi:hypothetical protein